MAKVTFPNGSITYSTQQSELDYYASIGATIDPASAAQPPPTTAFVPMPSNQTPGKVLAVGADGKSIVYADAGSGGGGGYDGGVES